MTFKIIHEIWITDIGENDTKICEVNDCNNSAVQGSNRTQLRRLLKFCGAKEEQDINHGGRVEKENPLMISLC